MKISLDHISAEMIVGWGLGQTMVARHSEIDVHVDPLFGVFLIRTIINPIRVKRYLPLVEVEKHGFSRTTFPVKYQANLARLAASPLGGVDGSLRVWLYREGFPMEDISWPLDGTFEYSLEGDTLKVADPRAEDKWITIRFVS